MKFERIELANNSLSEDYRDLLAYLGRNLILTLLLIGIHLILHRQETNAERF